MNPSFLLLGLFPTLVIVAALQDVTSYTIQNWISVALAAAFFPIALILGVPANLLFTHLGIGLIGLVLGMIMFGLGWIGGGDAKLFAAAALWLGIPAGYTYLAVTGVAGGALAVMLLSLRSLWVRPYVVNSPAWFGRLATPGENVPYGVAIAAGALVAFPLSTLVTALA
jgi:prepilin peptidase CpaA